MIVIKEILMFLVDAQIAYAYGIRYDDKTKLQLVVDHLLGPSHEAVQSIKSYLRCGTNKMRIILGLGPYVPTTHRWLEPVMGFRGFARVRANPFLQCRDTQRTRSCFLL